MLAILQLLIYGAGRTSVGASTTFRSRSGRNAVRLWWIRWGVGTTQDGARLERLPAHRSVPVWGGIWEVGHARGCQAGSAAGADSSLLSKTPRNDNGKRPR